jgi:hypothetical protein
MGSLGAGWVEVSREAAKRAAASSHYASKSRPCGDGTVDGVDANLPHPRPLPKHGEG